MTRILHLTHTHIFSDNRIFKQLDAVSKIDNCEVFGIGIVDPESPLLVSKPSQSFIVFSFNLYAKKIRFLGKTIKHLLVFIELAFRTFYKANKLRPSIVHCHDTMVLPIGLALKFLFGAKLIYDAHELESNRNALPSLFGRLIFFFEKSAWKFIDLFITVSPGILEWYSENISMPTRSCIILNTPYIAKFEKKNEELEVSSKYFHEKFKIPKDNKVFIYVGIIGKGRGIERTIDAFKSELVSSHIVFIGWGEQVNEVKMASRENHKIHYHQPWSHDELVQYISHADFGICMLENISLSDYLCLPNKLFEYLFGGIPVLASDFPEISKLLQSLNLGISCQDDLSSYINAINAMDEKEFSTDKSLLKEFSWSTQESRLIEVYKELIKLS